MGTWVVKSLMVLSGFLAHFSDMVFSEKYALAKLGLVAKAYKSKIERFMQEDSKPEACLRYRGKPYLKELSFQLL